MDPLKNVAYHIQRVNRSSHIWEAYARCTNCGTEVPREHTDTDSHDATLAAILTFAGYHECSA